MKIYCFYILFFLATIVHGQAAFEMIPFSDWQGKTLPDQDWVTLNGDTLNQNFFKGKVCFFNFFIAGCPSCMQEISHLNKLYKRYANSPDVCIVGIYGGDKKNYIKYYQLQEINSKASSNSNLQLTSSIVSVPKYTILLIDFNHFKFKYHAWRAPSNLIVDKKGIVQFCNDGFPITKQGQEQAYSEYISEIEKLRQ